MKVILEELWWWLDYHSEEVGKALLWILLAILTSPIWLCAGVTMWENAQRDYEYPYSGFRPETPEWWEPEPLYIQHEEEGDAL